MIIKASVSDMETVKHITLQTIKSIYPHYYPCGAVDFFINHHSDKNICNDIENDSVYLYYNDINIATGTITINENEISRFFLCCRIIRETVMGVSFFHLPKIK